MDAEINSTSLGYLCRHCPKVCALVLRRKVSTLRWRQLSRKLERSTTNIGELLFIRIRPAKCSRFIKMPQKARTNTGVSSDLLMMILLLSEFLYTV